MLYKTILIDPPWPQSLMGQWKRREKTATKLPYPIMTIDEIKSLRVRLLADTGCHLWLWSTNAMLPFAFEIMHEWGFNYLAPITWVKPSGCGNYFIHTTQHILFGYMEKCIFNRDRYKPTVLHTSIPKRHSEKPEEFYSLIESISDEPRLELFARNKRKGWASWGNEIDSDIQMSEKRGDGK